MAHYIIDKGLSINQISTVVVILHSTNTCKCKYTNVEVRNKFIILQFSMNRHYSAHYVDITWNSLQLVKRLNMILFITSEIILHLITKTKRTGFLRLLAKLTSEGGIFCECIGLLYICHPEGEGLGVLWKAHFWELQFLLLHRFHSLTPRLQSTAVPLGTNINKIWSIFMSVKILLYCWRYGL